MTFKCPPAGYTIDPQVARLQSALTMVLSSICMAVQHRSRVLIALILFIDILPRAISRPELSFSGGIAKKILKSLDLHARRIDAAPKRFTARVAVLLVAGIIIYSSMKLAVPALTIAGVLMIASTLDALMGFSIGCRLYEFWWSIFGKPRSPDQF